MMSATSVASEVTGNSIVQILQGETTQISQMVNIHEEAMVIEETLEEATVIQEEGAMKATTCPTMMVTSRGVIWAVL